jgi:hypothetical protein
MKKRVSAFFKLWWKYIPLIIISLIPLLWFVPGHLIDPNDTNFPLDPIALFKQRLFTWNNQHGEGINFSFDTAGISFHGTQALIYRLGFSVIQTEKIFLCLWFFLLLFSFYYFIDTVVKSKNIIVAYSATLFYVFNPYLFNIFSNINAANLAALFFIPITTALLWKVINQNISFKRFLLPFAVICFIAAPMGVNLPVLGAVLFYFAILFIGLFVYYRKTRLKKVVFTFLKIFLVFILFNAYWILPNLLVLYQKSAFALPTDIQLKTALDGFSAYNGINNLFRLQGDWVWRYDGFRGEKFVTFADNFINNRFLIVFSFISPFIFILSLIYCKRKIIVFLGLLLIPSLIFSSGSYPPLGTIFLFLTRTIPLFSVFRSPWYKFSIITVYIYATAVGFFFNYLISQKERRHWLLALFLLTGQLIYSYPMFTQDLFPAKRNVLPPAQFVVPDYPRETSNFLNQTSEDFTVISLPSNPADVYQWGFNGPYEFLNLYAPSKGILAGPAQNSANGLYDLFYKNFILGSNDVAKQMSFLNSRYLIHKKDSIYDFYYGSDEPNLIENILKDQPEIIKINNFGPWEFYENTATRPGIINLTDQLSNIFGSRETLGEILTIDRFNKNIAIFTDSETLDFKPTNNIFPLKLMPLQTSSNYDYSFPQVKYYPGNYFYPLIRIKEKFEINKVPKKTYKELQLRLQITGKRLIELKNLLENNRDTSWINNCIEEYLNDLENLDKFLFNDLINDEELPTYLKIAQPAIEKYLSELSFLKLNQSESASKTEEFKEKVVDFSINKLSNDNIFRYRIVLPVAENLNLYLIHLRPINPLVKNETSFEIDGKKYKADLKQEKDGWLSVDNLRFSKGEHIIGFPITNTEKYFEFYDWKYNNAKKVQQEISLDASANIATASVKINVKDTSNTSIIKFRYFATVGDTFRVDLMQENKKGYLIQEEPRVVQNLGAESWQNFTFEFQPDYKTDYLKLSFTLIPAKRINTKNIALIDDLNIFEKPKQLILFENIEEKKTTFDNSKYNIQKINPTLYKVKVENIFSPKLLTFR